jgi:hypothetical protein
MKLHPAFLKRSVCHVLAVTVISVACFLTTALVGPPPARDARPPPTAARQVWALYIASWGNPATDGAWSGWDRQHDDWNHTRFRPPEDLPSLHYPLLGPYSSHDEAVVRTHLAMIANASIDAIVVPWDGPSTANGTSSFTDRSLKILFRWGPSYGVQIVPLFKPVWGIDTFENMTADFRYYKSHFLKEKAQCRIDGQPVGIVYDAHLFKEATAFIENTPEMSFLAAALTLNDLINVLEEGYRGFVTYFASEAASWASSRSNWKILATSAIERNLIFVPAVSPGYNDSQIDRWNSRWVHSRGCSNFYDWGWTAAIDVAPPIVMVNSFNQWVDGSVIEPVVDRENYTLMEHMWCGTDPSFFLDRTDFWAKQFKAL